MMDSTQPGAESKDGTQSRRIKKYPNRRLYDTHSSSYVTLADIKQLVLQHDEFQVVDAKSGDDVTRQVLLQIISEEELRGMPLLSPELLSQMIRCYGSAMQGMLGGYLEHNMAALQDIQQALQEQLRRMQGEKAGSSQELSGQFLKLQGPAMYSLMQAYIEQSQKAFFQIFTGAAFTPTPGQKPEAEDI